MRRLPSPRGQALLGTGLRRLPGTGIVEITGTVGRRETDFALPVDELADDNFQVIAVAIDEDVDKIRGASDGVIGRSDAARYGRAPAYADVRRGCRPKSEDCDSSENDQ